MGFLQSIDQITIVGTGLLGGSLGLALKERGHRARRVGVGRRQETVDRALEYECIDEGTLDLGDALQPQDSEGVNLVVVATALGTFPAVFRDIAQFDHGQLVVTDVGSVKGYVLAEASRAGLNLHRFVGSHPMAGSEQQGPGAARADLFVNRPCIVTTDEAEATALGPRSDTLALVEELWQFVGMNVIRMPAAEHDRKVAVASHLPHALASIMIELVGRKEAFDVASSGLADTTRVASGDARIWADIFSTNREAVLESIDCCEQALKAFRERVDREDWEASYKWLDQMRIERDQWIERREQSCD